MITNIKNNIIEMTIVLKIVVFASLVGPFIAVYSILSGTIISGKSIQYEYGAAMDILELFVAVLLTLPVFVAGLLFLVRSNKARLLFIVGWISLCLSPFALSSIRNNYELFLIELTFNISLGVVVVAYLYLSSDIGKYMGDR